MATEQEARETLRITEKLIRLFLTSLQMADEIIGDKFSNLKNSTYDKELRTALKETGLSGGNNKEAIEMHVFDSRFKNDLINLIDAKNRKLPPTDQLNVAFTNIKKENGKTQIVMTSLKSQHHDIENLMNEIVNKARSSQVMSREGLELHIMAQHAFDDQNLGYIDIPYLYANKFFSHAKPLNVSYAFEQYEKDIDINIQKEVEKKIENLNKRKWGPEYTQEKIDRIKKVAISGYKQELELDKKVLRVYYPKAEEKEFNSAYARTLKEFEGYIGAYNQKREVKNCVFQEKVIERTKCLFRYAPTLENLSNQLLNASGTEIIKIEDAMNDLIEGNLIEKKDGITLSLKEGIHYATNNNNRYDGTIISLEKINENGKDTYYISVATRTINYDKVGPTNTQYKAQNAVTSSRKLFKLSEMNEALYYINKDMMDKGQILLLDDVNAMENGEFVNPYNLISNTELENNGKYVKSYYKDIVQNDYSKLLNYLGNPVKPGTNLSKNYRDILDNQIASFMKLSNGGHINQHLSDYIFALKDSKGEVLFGEPFYQEWINLSKEEKDLIKHIKDNVYVDEKNRDIMNIPDFVVHNNLEDHILSPRNSHSFLNNPEFDRN